MDENCAEKRSHVCKKRPNTFSPMTTLPTTVVPGYCPNGGITSGKGFCFQSLPDSLNRKLLSGFYLLLCRNLVMNKNGIYI